MSPFSEWQKQTFGSPPRTTNKEETELKHLLQRGFGCLAVVLVSSLFCFSSATSHAENDQQAIVNGMHQIVSNWSSAIRDGARFLSNNCYNGGWSAHKLSEDTTISFDVKRTDSLVSPYIGILMLNGLTESNLACAGTPDAALANDNFITNTLATRELIVYYKFDGQSFRLSGGSEVFTNAILTALTTPSAHNAEIVSKYGLLELRMKSD